MERSQEWTIKDNLGPGAWNRIFNRMDNQRDIRIITRKLGREKAYGLAHIEEKIIEIDPRQKPKTLLDTELHEFFHIRHPEWSESKVCREARATTKFLWSLKYRKINE